MSSFDKVYSKRPSVFGSKPSWRLEQFLSKNDLVSNGIALDLGCGHGRDTIFLAQNGFEVHAYDLSEKAVSTIQSISKQKFNGRIQARSADISNLMLPRSTYSIIVARTILDHIDGTIIPSVVERIKMACRPGGGVFISVFTVDDPGNAPNSKDKSEFAGDIKYYFPRGELLRLFSDFHLEAYEEVRKEDHSHGPAHVHAKARIAAIKPL